MGLIAIPFLRKLKIGQPILKYVKEHKEKNGTPTMGGLFFIIPSIIVFIVFTGFSIKKANVSWAIGLAFLVVGFLDDFIKIKTKSNEGLKPYQKILFLTGIAFLCGVFCFYNGLSVFNIPFSNKVLDFGVSSIFIIAIIFIATTNCVNLTDGLDGLAGSVSLIYLLFISFLIFLQNNHLSNGYSNDIVLIYFSFSLIGGLSAFLCFNFGGAKVFMGDTGSLSLGGIIAVVSLFSGNGLYIPIIGITFVFSGLSVIIQVLYYKRTKKRVFLMAPFHHHLQLNGIKESKIVYIYCIVSVLMGGLSVIFYL